MQRLKLGYELCDQICGVMKVEPDRHESVLEMLWICRICLNETKASRTDASRKSGSQTTAGSTESTGAESGRSEHLRPISCLDVCLQSENHRTEAESSVSTKYLLVLDGRLGQNKRYEEFSVSITYLEVEVRTFCGDSRQRKLELKPRIFSSCRPTADWRDWIWVFDCWSDKTTNLNLSPLASNKLQTL